MQDTTSPKSFSDLLDLFPADAQQAILAEAQAQVRRLYDQVEGHGAHCYCTACSDSRESSPTDVGGVIYYRAPGGFGTDANGKILLETELGIERAFHDGTPVVETRQHSSCGLFASLYKKMTLGADYVKAHYGNHFRDTTVDRSEMFLMVKKRLDDEGPDFYKDFGIKLDLPDNPAFDEAARFQTYMAIEQGFRCHDAKVKKCEEIRKREEKKAKENPGYIPRPVPTALYVFRHVSENGRIYAYDDREAEFVPFPLKSDLLMSLDKNKDRSPEEQVTFEKEFTAYMNGVQNVMKRFPNPDVQSRIWAELNSQIEWMTANEMNEKADLSQKQAPAYALMGPGNPQTEAPHDGAESEAGAKIKSTSGVGASLEFRNYTGFLTEPNGNLSQTAGLFAELARAYGVATLQIMQPTQRQFMEVLYDYKQSAKGRERILDEYGPAHVAACKAYGSLYDDVLQNLSPDSDELNTKPTDFSAYEKMLGEDFKLDGQKKNPKYDPKNPANGEKAMIPWTTKDKVVACMVIEQLRQNFLALQQAHEKTSNYLLAEKKDREGNIIKEMVPLPAPVAFLTRKDGGPIQDSHVLIGANADRLEKLPHVDAAGDLIVGTTPTRHDPKKAAAEVTKVLG